MATLQRVTALDLSKLGATVLVNGRSEKRAGDAVKDLRKPE